MSNNESMMTRSQTNKKKKGKKGKKVPSTPEEVNGISVGNNENESNYVLITDKVSNKDDLLLLSSQTDVTASSELDVDLKREFANLTEDLVNLRLSNTLLRKEVSTMKEDMSTFVDKIYYLERDLAMLNQYNRRENVEIIGIPSHISQRDLENYVIAFLREMNIEVSSYDIVGCHRLPKRKGQTDANVIVRFLNRKNAILCLRRRSQISGIQDDELKKLYIVENLCPSYRSVYDTCADMKKYGDVKKFWSYNGIINVKFTDNENERPTKIFHIDDLS